MIKKTTKYFFHFTPARIFLLINLIFIGGIFVISGRSDVFVDKEEKDIAVGFKNQKIVLKAFVCEEADIDYKSRRLTICGGSRFLITTNLYPEYDYGDFLELSGKLQIPERVDDFNYGAYLARYNIYAVMYYPQIRLLDKEMGDKSINKLSRAQEIYRMLLNFKQSLKSLMEKNLPEPEAGLASAILLGYKRTVAKSDLAIFSRVGLSHLIAISGSHITILSGLIVGFLTALGLSRRRSLFFIFLFLFFYPFLTGLAASAVRSAIMSGLIFIAFYFHRSSVILNALIFSASLMLIFNPLLLRNDIGFQLSYLAILGIIYLYPIADIVFADKISSWKISLRIKNILKALFAIINLTLVSQIATLPILLINFKQLSFISPLANILVIWTFPFLLASLIIALFLSALFPVLSLFWFFPAYLFLKFIFLVSTGLASFSWAAISIYNFNWRQGMVYYFILVLFVILYFKKYKKRSP